MVLAAPGSYTVRVKTVLKSFALFYYNQHKITTGDVTMDVSMCGVDCGVCALLWLVCNISVTMWRLAIERLVTVDIGASSEMNAKWRLRIERRILAVIWMSVMLNCRLGEMRRQLRVTKESSSTFVHWGFVEYSASIVTQTSFFGWQRKQMCRNSSGACCRSGRWEKVGLH